MVWLRVIRIKFFLAGLPTVILGTAVAWYVHKLFSLELFILTLLGVCFAMAGCYLFNEYFDYKSGVDLAISPSDIIPFSGGSRVLPEGLMSPSAVFRAGILFWGLAGVIGIYLTMLRGWVVLLLTLAGFIAGAFYTSPPFKWAYRGLGEVLIGLTYGPLIAMGSYYVQLSQLHLKYIIPPAIIPGILITAVIWINEFPD